MERLLIVFALLLVCSPVSAKRTCKISPTRAVQVSVALLSSPTWVADLVELESQMGRRLLDCTVDADAAVFMTVANLSNDPSPIVPPYLSVGIERARQWLKVHDKITCGEGK